MSIIKVKILNCAPTKECTPQQELEYRKMAKEEYNVTILENGDINFENGYEIIEGEGSDISFYLEEIYGYTLEDEDVQVMDDMNETKMKLINICNKYGYYLDYAHIVKREVKSPMSKSILIIVNINPLPKNKYHPEIYIDYSGVAKVFVAESGKRDDSELTKIIKGYTDARDLIKEINELDLTTLDKDVLKDNN